MTRQELREHCFKTIYGIPCSEKAKEEHELVVNILDRLERYESIRCDKCKYYEEDHFAVVDGVPIIVAHEICTKWADGCKTKSDGHCHMFKEKKKNDSNTNMDSIN